MAKSGPINVLFVNDHLGFPGGVVHGGATYLINTLPAFDPTKVRASLAIFRPYHRSAEDLEALGVPVRFFGRAKWDPRCFSDLLRLMEEWDVDILHAEGQKSHLLTRLAGLRTNTPTIIHLHFQYRPRPEWLHRRLAASTAMALTVSGVLRGHAIARFGIPPERARVAYNGLHVDRFRDPPPASRSRIREELGLDDSRLLLTVTGRIMRHGSPSDKGQLVAIRATERLKDDYPTAILALVGDGPGRPECESLVADLGLDDRVIFVGQRSDIPDILAATDILLMPSAHHEAFGYSCLEAMCAGRPVVASRVGGLPEMLAGGKRGVLVPPHDADGLAAGVAWVIDHPDEASRLADAGQRFACGLTVGRHVDQLTRVYDEILSR